MVNLFFGSSNVYRNYSRALGLGLFAGRDLELVNCTKKTVLDARLVTVNAPCLIVVSVLENFVVSVCSDVSEEEVQLFARQQVTAHVEELHNVAVRVPGVNIVISPPMFRSDPAWFGSYLPDLQSFLAEEVARVGSGNLALCSPFVVVPSLLEDDGVHLTPQGGDRFMSHLDAQLNALLVEVPSVFPPAEDRLDQILNAVNRNSSQLETFRTIGDTVIGLTRSTANFESFVRRRFKDDDLIFARMKEETDSDINRAREDRVVITGLAVPAVAGSTHVEKKKYYTEVVTRLVSVSCASAEQLPVVVDVYVNLRKERGLPLIEARFDSVSGAQLFRREGVRLAKAKHAEFGSLFFSNSVTQSTRVRIEILRELSKKLNTATEVAFVQGFISRPVLQYRVKEGARSRADGVGRSYTFVDAVARFGNKLAQRDLTNAYVRAGNTFDGALSQYFVVLVDDHDGLRSRSVPNRTPLGRRGFGLRGSSRGGRQLRQTQLGFPVLDRGVKRIMDSSDADVSGPSKRQEQEQEEDMSLSVGE